MRKYIEAFKASGSGEKVYLELCSNRVVSIRDCVCMCERERER